MHKQAREINRAVNPLTKSYGGSKVEDRHVINGVDQRLLSPDNVYLDAQIVNTYSDRIIPATYATTRNQAILKKPNDYYLAVTRFNIPTTRVPLFNFQNNFYQVTMIGPAGEATGYVQYINYAITPADPENQFIFSVQQFLDAVNATIRTVAAAAGFLVADVPYVWFNRETGIQSIHFSNNANWLDTTISPPDAPWQLWFNWNLYYFFYTLAVYSTRTYNPPDGKGYKILVKNNLDGNYTTAGPITGYEMQQDTPLLSLYVLINSIIISTTSIPISAELISIKETVNNSGGNTQFGIGNSATFNTIADFVPGQLANFSDNFTSYLYNPQFYRLVDLISNSPLNKFDFQIYYTDIFGDVFPIYLQPFQRASVKFVFVKKSLFNNEYD
jgi:hypothetical protein